MGALAHAGFVGKEGRYVCAEIFSEMFVIPFMCRLKKGVMYLGPQQVHIRKSCHPAGGRIGSACDDNKKIPAFRPLVPGHMAQVPGMYRHALFFLRGKHCDGFLGYRGRIPDDGTCHKRGKRFGAGGRDMSPGKSGRIGIFVIDGQLHAQFFCLFQGMSPEGKPFVGQILSHQTGSGMYKRAAEAMSGQLGELEVDLIRCHAVIPYPEWGGTVFSGGIFKVTDDSFHIGTSDFSIFQVLVCDGFGSQWAGYRITVGMFIRIPSFSSTAALWPTASAQWCVGASANHRDI